IRHLGKPEERLLAIEGPDETPFFGGGIVVDADRRRNARRLRNLDAASIGGKLPMMIGATHLSIDERSETEISPDMRTVGALHHRLALGIAIDDDARPEKILPHDLSGRKIRREQHGVPILEIGTVVLATVFAAEGPGDW